MIIYVMLLDAWLHNVTSVHKYKAKEKEIISA